MCGPCHGGTSAQRDRRGCSCGLGNHAYGSGDGCLVEMCASRRSLSDVSNHVPGETCALMDTSCGLTKQGYGARGASPNHPRKPPAQRTLVKSPSTARYRLYKPHIRGFPAPSNSAQMDQRQRSNNIDVSYSHRTSFGVAPAYGRFLFFFPFRPRAARFRCSALARHMSTSCGQLCG